MNGGGHMGRHAGASAQGGKRQDPQVTHDLPVSLEDIYKGTIKKMKITRKVLNADGQSTSIEDKVLTIQVRAFYSTMHLTRVVRRSSPAGRLARR